LAHAAEPAELRNYQFLLARVEVEIRNGMYTYKIINSEANQFVAAFHLDIKKTPITVVEGPPGSTGMSGVDQTDNSATYSRLSTKPKVKV
jgi:hypothetical protein